MDRIKSIFEFFFELTIFTFALILWIGSTIAVIAIIAAMSIKAGIFTP